MKMGLTLLAQSGLPKVFWVDAFLTSIFIINSLPTKVLDYSSPYERLFQRSPDFSYFRTFSCQCFPCLRPYSLDKLSFRSKPCIFIGYCSNHKGFRCFDPSSKRVYISRNVIFDEGIFPAREQSIFTDSANCLDSSGTSNTLFLPLSSPPFNFFLVSSSNTVSTHQTSLNITLPDNPISPLPSTHPDSSSPASLLHTPVLPADQPETFPTTLLQIHLWLLCLMLLTKLHLLIILPVNSLFLILLLVCLLDPKLDTLNPVFFLTLNYTTLLVTLFKLCMQVW